MQKILLLIASHFYFNFILAENEIKSWQGIHETPLSSLEQQFAEPPVEFANHVIWGWEGKMDKKTICNDLDSIKKKGFRAVIFEAGYKLPFKYLSEEWFKAIRTGVLEAKKRGMKVWIIDEGKYPSGFAGGKFSQERPDLRMQALVIDDTIQIKRGEVMTNHKIAPEIISAVAVSTSGAPNRTVEIDNGKISFNAGVDDWKILLVKSDFRTAVTRAVNNPNGGKDATNSLCDYLNPVAVQQFIDWTHEQYKKYLGKELGRRTRLCTFTLDSFHYPNLQRNKRIRPDSLSGLLFYRFAHHTGTKGKSRLLGCMVQLVRHPLFQITGRLVCSQWSSPHYPS